MAADEAHGPAREVDQWANLTRAAYRLGWPRERLRSLARRGRLQTRRTNTGELLILLTPELVAQAQADPGPTSRPTQRPAYRSDAADPEADLEASPGVGPWASRVAGLQVGLAKAIAERDAARAVAIADVTAAKMVAEAEIAGARAEAAAKDQVIGELKAMLAEARRPWWRRWIG